MYSSAVTCLRKYQLCYIDKIVPEAPESGDLAFGSALHSALNGILTGENGEELFSIYWDSYETKELTYGRFKWKELKDLGLNFCSKFARLQAPKYKVQQAEVRLYGEYKGIKLEGTFDFLGEYNGRTSLRDFKTAGYNYDKAKAHTALQLNLYAFLATSTDNIRSSELNTLGYTVFNKGTGSIQDLTWDFDEKVMYSMLDDMVAYCASIDSRQSYPKNPNSCLMGSLKCQYFDNCWGKK